MLTDWTLSKLAPVNDRPRVLVRDPLRLLPPVDGRIDSFGTVHSFHVIVTDTNLHFRDRYEAALGSPEITKILVIDRTPARRRERRVPSQAPPAFYPDLLAVTPPEARIDLSLRQFLIETTGDPLWPAMADEPRYARLIATHLEGVIRAHRNLRAADSERFTDFDFVSIVAFAALGVPEAAFRKLGAEEYWRIGLLAHEPLAELDALAPDVTKPIKEQIRHAPAPFCWLAYRDSDTVIRAFYLSAILAQHFPSWSLLLANVDPQLAQYSSIKDETLREAAPKLVALNPAQAHRDLEALERSLDSDALHLLLFDQMKLAGPAVLLEVLERERYSTLIRSLALLLAVGDMLSISPAPGIHARVSAVIFPDAASAKPAVVDARPSPVWADLKEAYRLAGEIRSLRGELGTALKTLGVLETGQLSFGLFWHLWNDKKINRLEHYLSAMERLADSGNLLPRPGDELPPAFAGARDEVRRRVRSIADEVSKQLDEVNRRFQDLVAAQYPVWVKGEEHEAQGKAARSLPLPFFEASSPVLTSRFLRRCLKPFFDPQKEKAVLFVFDGMRYDIWDELLKPMLLDRMELLAELPGCSLLPSETHVTRKAISAGTFPDEFDSGRGEDRLLEEGLARELGYRQAVETIAPEGAATGETVRYRAGNLDVYIFELCDKELHKIKIKDLQGRLVPGRPLSFVYQQIKNIVDTEVLAIVRGLPAGTKVFVTADHGFGRVGREALWFDEGDLNEPRDCAYLDCRLRVPIDQASLLPKVRSNVIAFTPAELRMPRQETFASKGGPPVVKPYGAVVFPKVGFSFSRKGSPYHPDAYSHGGISLQEMLVPMAVLQVRPREEGLLALDPIVGPAEMVEGEEVEFRLPVRRSAGGTSAADEVRVEVDASYSLEPDLRSLPHQVLYIPAKGRDAVYRFHPDPADATNEERREGVMSRVLTVAISYREGRGTARKSRAHRFTVRLNSERIVRRVGNLGAILGLTPKSMRG